MQYPANRPYFKLGGADLEELFKKERNNRTILEQIKGELIHRDRPAMRRLAAKVDEALMTVFCSPAGVAVPACLAAPRPEQSETVPAVSSQKSTRVVARADEEPEEDEPEVDPSPKKLAGPIQIRPRGGAPDTPETYRRTRETSLTLPTGPSVSTRDRYVVAIEAHVAELKAKGGGKIVIAVHDGRRVSLEGGKVGYQFSFDGEADEVFEGAGVMIRAGKRASQGRVVSVILPEKTIVVETDDDLGDTVGVAELRIDNSAMLQQLADRLKNLGGTDAGQFNSTLAEAVLCNGGVSLEGPPLKLPPTGNNTDLDSDQENAARTSLGNSISYIWGPPGSGKTVTLTGIVHSLFSAEERVLVCSNTNQAVDQILYRLCKIFKGIPLVENGLIVRVGRIELRDLKEEFSAYVTPAGIAERLGENLRKQKAELEIELRRLAQELLPFAAAETVFRQIDDAQRELKGAEERKYHAAQERSGLANEIAANRAQIQTAEEALVKWHSSGPLRRLLLEPEETTKRKIVGLNQTRVTLDQKRRAVESSYEEASVAPQRLAAQIQALQGQVRGFERPRVLQRIREIEQRRSPVADALAAVNRQLAEMEESVLKNAKVIGATVTKLYLSPKQFQNFDTVVIDEASMVLPPALFHAAGLSKKRVVVCGDFRQLPPIVATDQQAIFDVLGRDVFCLAGIADAMHAHKPPRQLVMLTRQRRMVDEICQLITRPMYDGRLVTEPGRPPCSIPAPFNQAITIIDTSSLNPFVGFDEGGSRYNLVHAVVARNAALFIRKHANCGVSVGFKAQNRLIGRMIKEAGGEDVVVGVVHRFQGNEKQAMIIDLPEGIGDYGVSRFLQGESQKDEGPRLLNVAISRAKSHLILIINRRFLDAKLPSNAVVREILYKAQETGTVIDARDVLAFHPVDWTRVAPPGSPFTLSPSQGLFDQNSFGTALRADFAAARQSVVIFSGFITVARTASLGDIFRQMLARGVKIRCVTRSAYTNPGEPEQTDEALEALRQLGCVVDLRAKVHQKVVLIDGKIAWFGSLNPLSYTTGTDEIMMRVEGEETAKQIAEYLALPGFAREGRDFWAQENPTCGKCGSPTVWLEKRGGFFLCTANNCHWTTDLRKIRQPAAAQGKGSGLPEEGPACPKCGGKTRLRTGQWGQFYGCEKFPKCKGKQPVGVKSARRKK
ncbi:MAG: AAA domain-containing protein [Opitutaceae bacterium]|nr:AAA domain-containing protein [Opitutaceae bacterium]